MNNDKEELEFLKKCEYKLTLVPCPKCHVKASFKPFRHERKQIRGHRAIIFHVLCESCLQKGPVVIYETSPEELAKAKARHKEIKRLVELN